MVKYYSNRRKRYSYSRRPYKKYYSKKQRNRKKMRMTRAIAPWSHVVKHRYVEMIRPEVVTGGNYQAVFRANCLFNINPNGFDLPNALGYKEWSGLYEGYVVVGSKCRFTVTATNTFSGSNVCAAIRTQAAPISNLIEMSQNTGAKIITLGIPEGGRNQCILTRKFSAKKYTKTKVLTNENLMCDEDETPDNAWYYHLYIQNDSDSEPGLYIIQVEIQYSVVWTKVKEIPLSMNS